jgi:hypothetical protein
MKEQTRAEPRFFLCGLNCGLCPMYHISETEHMHGLRRRGPSLLRGAAVRAGARRRGILLPVARNIPVPVTPVPLLMTPSLPHRNVQRDFARADRDGLDDTGPMWRKRKALDALFAA